MQAVQSAFRALRRLLFLRRTNVKTNAQLLRNTPFPFAITVAEDQAYQRRRDQREQHQR